MHAFDSSTDAPITFTGSNGSITFYPAGRGKSCAEAMTVLTAFSIVAHTSDCYRYLLNRVHHTTTITVQHGNAEITSVATKYEGTEYSIKGKVTADLIANHAYLSSDVVDMLDSQIKHEFSDGEWSLNDVAAYFFAAFVPGNPTMTGHIVDHSDEEDYAIHPDFGPGCIFDDERVPF